MRAVLALALALALGTSCKKKKEEPASSPLDRVIVKASELADRMCGCKDRACVDHETARQETWAASVKQELAALRVPGTSTFFQRREYQAVVKRNARCLESATTPPDAGVPDAAPPAPIAVIGTQIRDRIAEAQTGGSKLGRIHAKYVDKDGVLDPEAGEVEITFGLPAVATSATRRTGAPVKKPAVDAKCYSLRLHHGTWSRRGHISCGATMESSPTCDVLAIWNRAIADGAPADAVAVITLEATGTWMFSIVDAERGVNITKTFRDDCPIAVEQAPPD